MSEPFPFHPLISGPLLDDDIWFPLSNGLDTREEVSERIPDFVAAYAGSRMSQWLTDDAMLMTILNSLARITNEETLALGHARIPTRGQTDDTLRANIAYLHEKFLGMPAIIADIRENHIVAAGQKYKLDSLTARTKDIQKAIKVWWTRAMRIMDIMRDARTKVGPLAQNADVIRDAARITLGEIPGLQMTTLGNAVKLGRIENAHLQLYRLVENNTFMLVQLDDADNDDADQVHNQTDGLQITAKNSMAIVRTKAAKAKRWTEVLLAQDATHNVTVAQLNGRVEARPLYIPKVGTAIATVSMETTEARSVALANAFSGDRLTYTAVVADTTLLTAHINAQTPAVILDSQTQAGTTTVTITATNEAGSTTTSFQVTIAQAAAT